MHAALSCVSTSVATQVEAVDMDRSRGRTSYTVRLTAPGDVHLEQRWETIEEDDEVREVTVSRRAWIQANRLIRKGGLDPPFRFLLTVTGIHRWF
eukprot:COSAG01_NODE_89_length_27311_cov_22.687061_5_plen_95_part_00